MQGLLTRSARCLASYRDGRRLSDAYQLLLTKKPAEYDYVAIDATSFVGGAMRLAKNVTTDTRKSREVARHVSTAIQHLLRRLVIRHSLLIAFDGSQSASKVMEFRTAKATRRLENRQQRLPGMPLLRAVEERIVKSMPLTRGLIPRETVVSGVHVEGSVEQKVSAWALDLACRDGPQQHTTRSLCLIGSGELWLSMLALTPYFQGTHVMHGATDLRHLTLSDALAWLELRPLVEAGDTLGVTTGRTDALLLYLLCSGSETTALTALPGAQFTVLLDAYHRCRTAAAKGDGALTPPHSQQQQQPAKGPTAKSATTPFQLLRDLPDNRLELDLLALYTLLIPERDIAAEIAELTQSDPRPFVRSSSSSSTTTAVGSAAQATPASVLKTTSVTTNTDLFCESYLSHLLSTHHLFCYGESTYALQSEVPAYLSLPGSLDALLGMSAGEETVFGGDSSSSGGARIPLIGDAAKAPLITVAAWVRYLRTCIQQGCRFRQHDDSQSARQRRLQPLRHDTGALAAHTAESAQPEAVEGGQTAIATIGPPAASTDEDAFFPFWTANQPMTAAEFTMLCQTNHSYVEPLLREYVPGVASRIRPDFPRRITSPRLSVEEGRATLQRIFARANADTPHPALCLSPSYCWTQQEKSKLWSMRYVDLGVQAKEEHIRHARSLLSGMNMTQQNAEDGAVVYDAAAGTWVVLQQQQQVSSTPAATASPASAAEKGEGQHSADAASVVHTQTLKVLTWNVMFDRYSNQPTPLGMPGIDWCSPKRYPVLAKLIAQEDADVVGMQEVEPAFAEYLATQPWCRERYILSCSPRSAILDPWGVLLLIKRGGQAWPLHQLTHLNVPAWSGHVSLMPVATLDVYAGRGSPSARARPTGSSTAAHASRLVNVCSMHLLAPFIKAHETARTGQDQALRTCLTRQLHGDTLVMGDFNDWPSNEFDMPPETRYTECWPLVHPKDYGKTMDESNTFCKLKIEETFFGRSDKLFLRTGVGSGSARPLLKPVEAHLVGTRSVNVENGNADAPAYLFPSDHYGVSMTFDVLQGHP